MHRYKLTIEYNGSSFYGWQKQKELPSVQQTLEEALQILTNEKTTIYCAGRTDAGVHANGQVAHFDCAREFDPFALQEGLNNNVKKRPVAIIKTELLDQNFNARRDAKKRHYIYKIINRYPYLTFQKGLFLHARHKLDTEAMRSAGKMLIGTHDFSSFRDARCQSKTPIKTIYDFDIVQINDTIELHFIGRSFLHHQVRNMVGTLLLIGNGKITEKNFQEIIAACDRTKAGATAPAEGLYLFKIEY